MDLFENFKVTRIEGNDSKEFEDPVIREFPLKIQVNGEEMLILVCSPQYLEELAVGYLYTQGILDDISGVQEINVKSDLVSLSLKEVNFNPRKLKHRVLTSGCGKSMIYTDLNGQGLKKVREELLLTPEIIRDCVHRLKEQSLLFKKTGGVHAALLQEIPPVTESKPTLISAADEFFSLFREDVGRHNAVDKIAGYLILNRVKPGKKILAISGRISAEILLKTVRIRIPVLISPSAPTEMAIRLAHRLGVTLIGFARGKRMNIYCHPERILTD